MAIMVYALVTYHWRASAIRNKGSGPYDDRLGEQHVYRMMALRKELIMIVDITLQALLFSPSCS